MASVPSSAPTINLEHFGVLPMGQLPSPCTLLQPRPPLLLLATVASLLFSKAFPQALAAGLGGSDSRLGILRGSLAPLELSKAVQLSSAPNVYVYHGFLSDAECQHLIQNALHELEAPSGKPLAAATILPKYQDSIVRRIEDRLTDWLLLPKKRPEDINVLRYNEGQQFDVHYEFFSNPGGDNRKGGRAATVLLFLSDVEGGGEIVLPRARVKSETTTSQTVGLASSSSCSIQGLTIPPRKGSALFISHLHSDGTYDLMSEVSECPVTAGERWMAAKWIAVQKYSKRRDPNECIDEHDQCEIWAARGECKANPEYMIGAKGSFGHCRKACKVCTPLKKKVEKTS